MSSIADWTAGMTAVPEVVVIEPADEQVLRQAQAVREAIVNGVDHDTALAEMMVDLHAVRRFLFEEYDQCAHAMAMLMQRDGKKVINVGTTHRVRLVPSSTRYSPSQRRRIRKEHPAALLTPDQLPPTVKVEKQK